MTTRRRVKGAPRRKACNTCRNPILLVRDLDEPGTTHVLNGEQQEGGTFVLVGQGDTARAQELPPGRGLGYTRHTCGRPEQGGAHGPSPDPDDAF